ncbi:MAG: hypothetical protein K1W19_13585 [Lachnospiraceae bacterium]|nr:hypothetical protein [Lachnospiraceae bacterium]
MKQPKKLTLEQKKAVSTYHLNPKNWMLVEDMGAYLKIVHKTSRNVKFVDKYAGGKGGK